MLPTLVARRGSTLLQRPTAARGGGLRPTAMLGGRFGGAAAGRCRAWLAGSGACGAAVQPPVTGERLRSGRNSGDGDDDGADGTEHESRAVRGEEVGLLEGLGGRYGARRGAERGGMADGAGGACARFLSGCPC